MAINNRKRYLFLMAFIIFSFLGCSNQSDTNKSNLNSITSSNKVTSNASIVTSTAIQTNETSIPNKSTDTNGTLKVHFIDVGQADCILINSPDGKNMLIDAGNNGDTTTITSYLNNNNIKKIDVLIGTHPHEDHIGSLDTVIKEYEIGEIYMPKKGTTTKTFQDVLNAIQQKGLKVSNAIAGAKIDFSPLVNAEMLAPNGTTYEDLNDYTAVVKLTYGTTSFLFEGDAENISEKEMIAKGYDLTAQVLKIGHHGSTSSTSDRFLNLVNPKYAVVSVGKGNSYGHPSASTIQKLDSKGIEIFRTDEQGTIIFTTDGNTIKIDKKASEIKENAPPQTINNQKTESIKNSTGIVDQEIFRTVSGKKYHLDGCSSLSKSKIPITLKEAKEKGLGPCKICNPLY